MCIEPNQLIFSFLYVLLANATTITVSSLDAPGQATPLQKFDVAAAMQSAGVNVTVNPFNVQGLTVFIAGGSSDSNTTTASNSTSSTSNNSTSVKRAYGRHRLPAY